ASIVSAAFASMLRATLTIRPPATSTSMPLQPSASVALRMMRSDIFLMFGVRKLESDPSYPVSRVRPNFLAPHSNLLSAEYTVARVAQPRHDVAVIVQLPVDRRGGDRELRVRLLERPDALRTGDETDETDRARTRFLQTLDRGDRRMSGGEHRIDDDRVALDHAARYLEVV